MEDIHYFWPFCLYECKLLQIILLFVYFLESIQEQLGEAEGKGLRAEFGLSLYTHC